MRPALRGSRGSAPGVPRKRGGASDALSSASEVALANELRAPGAGALSASEVALSASEVAKCASRVTSRGENKREEHGGRKKEA